MLPQFTEMSIKELVIQGIDTYIHDYGETWMDCWINNDGTAELSETIHEVYGVAIDYSIIDNIFSNLDIHVELKVKISVKPSARPF